MSARNDQEELGNVNRRSVLLGTSSLFVAATLPSSALAQAQKAATPSATPLGGTTGSKPNILFIMGDDIGWFNVSAYNMGIMGYRTPNIDRIGKEGAVFTDWYGQQSCTAGRAAFITGQSPIRTGLTKVGLPGAELGLGPQDPSVAEVLKTLRLRHRPVRQEPSRRPRRASCRPCTASTSSSATSTTSTPRKSRRTRLSEGPGVPKAVRSTRRVIKIELPIGKIENTGPLTTKRMETVDEEFLAARHGLHRSPAQGQQAVVLLLQLHPHARLHASEAGVGGQDRPRHLSRRHGRTRRHGRPVAEASSTTSASPTTPSSSTPPTTAPRSSPGPTAARRHSSGEKATNWEGGFRVPCVIRWPGVIKPGTVINDICSHEDFIPTFARPAASLTSSRR